MIELHRKTGERSGEELEQKLRDLRLAFRVEVHDTDAAGKPLPRIEESGQIVSGKPALDIWLLQLEKELTRQRSISGDGCYIDPDSGAVC
ncbi:MAG: hypothetical protein ACNA78_06225 [Balneolaceae bacterium]